MINLPSDYSVDARILEQLLEYDHLTTSYKLFWFASVFKEVICGKQSITFKRIVCRMIASAWYPLLQYHLNFGISDKLNDIVVLIYKKYGINSDINEEELLLILENLQDFEVEKRINDFYKYVPYRLVSPFFSDVLLGLKDGDKNKIILKLSQNSTKALYQILILAKTIHINDNWFNYIIKNQNVISGWLKYKLIYYLQKKNPNVPAIPFKLTAPCQRELSMTKKFWNEVKKQQIVYDIYTDKSLTQTNFEKYGELSIDHFIPWSFVLHDQLWNLIPTFKNINSSKSNKLPKLELYIDKFCDVQYMAFRTVRRSKESKRLLEDYLTINKNLDLNEFVDSLKSTITPLFQIAYNQGYDQWQNYGN